ncbi:MAG: molybdopterin-guanine dinucleotide biosynthesis protein MobA [Anaerolinea sp.]|nr:molybdopterin-guanine dinucleotide biosynthesis protein MobA [Anaerolinea sp.]
MTAQRPETAVTFNEWLERLAALLPGDSPNAATPREQAAILDLARVAAHTSERIAAPISAFLVGVAYASLPPDKRAEQIGELVRTLEQESLA